MSCYVNFFVRVDDKFARIGSFSRNSAMYTFLEDNSCDAPWEKIDALTIERVTNWITDAKNEIAEMTNAIDGRNRKKDDILKANNELDDKLEILESIYEDIEIYNERIAEYTRLINYFTVYTEIMEERKYDYEESGKFIDNSGKVLYYGVEISEPTVDDIV